jgi:hypothetical protein
MGLLTLLYKAVIILQNLHNTEAIDTIAQFFEFDEK